MTRDLLIVLNPRQIDECVDAIRALNIDQAWLTGYTEHELEDVIEAVIDHIDHAHYEHVLILPDDTIPTQAALDAILDLLRAGHPVVTGYCNLDERADEDRVNLTRTPLTEPRTVASYDFWTQAEIDAWALDVIPTYFAGFALTGMSRELWQRFPFRAYGNPGCSSDYHLSLRLHNARVPIVAPKAGRIHHVKETWNTRDREARKGLLIGLVPQRVELVEAVTADA